MNGAAWQAAIYGVTKSWTRLSDFTFTFRVIYAKAFDCVDHNKLWEIL